MLVADVGEGDVIFGREFFGAESRVYARLLEDFRPVMNFCKFVSSELCTRPYGLPAMLHKKIYYFVEQMHALNSAGFVLFANKTYYCRIDLRLGPEDCGFESPDHFDVTGCA